MSNDKHSLDQAQIEGVLCAKYNATLHTMLALSSAAALAAAFLYSDTLQAIPRDFVSMVLLACLVVGWTFLWIERIRSAKRAAAVTRILSSESFKPIFDRDRGTIVLEAREILSFGGRETESVTARIELSAREAKEIDDLLKLVRLKGTLALPAAH